MTRCFLAIFLAVAAMGFAPPHHDHMTPSSSAPSLSAPRKVADVALVNQAGAPRRLYTDLVKGRTAVVSFIFTRCASTCPIITAKLQRVQENMAERMGKDVVFLSVSVDPSYDTAPRLAAYARKFDAGRGWQFLTGSSTNVTAALKSFGQSPGPAAAHSERILIINDAKGVTSGIDGTKASPAQIAKEVLRVANAGLPRAVQAARYFSNLPVVDGAGRPINFYRDVLANRIVVLSTMFTRCQDACPLIAAKLAAAESKLSPDASRGVRFVAISSDPAYDTPPRLREFAAKHHLGSSWTLVTGKPENVQWILYRLGLDGVGPQDHSTQILIGNETNGEWKRVAPTVSPTQLAQIIASASGKRQP